MYLLGKPSKISSKSLEKEKKKRIQQYNMFWELCLQIIKLLIFGCICCSMVYQSTAKDTPRFSISCRVPGIFLSLPSLGNLEPSSLVYLPRSPTHSKSTVHVWQSFKIQVGKWGWKVHIYVQLLNNKHCARRFMYTIPFISPNHPFKF